jgi:membrane AbrB-like protein
MGKTEKKIEKAVEATAADGAAAPAGKSNSLKWQDWIALAVIGFLSAWVFTLLNIPSGTLIGPTVTIAVYTNLRRLKVQINKNLQSVLQVGVGGMVGLSITMESIRSLSLYIFPIVSLNIILVGGCFLLAFVLHKISSWDILTCLFATAPGGLSSMILLSMESSADTNRVIIFQVLRMALVVALIPLIGRLLF